MSAPVWATSSDRTPPALAYHSIPLTEWMPAVGLLPMKIYGDTNSGNCLKVKWIGETERSLGLAPACSDWLESL